MEEVESRNGEGRVLLLMRGTVLGVESIIRPYMNLCLRLYTSQKIEETEALTTYQMMVMMILLQENKIGESRGIKNVTLKL
jgi:hypothetical protein